MNAMGHSVPTMIGVQQDDLTPALQKLLPDYMAMGSQGMAEMTEMDMPLPDNTLPMMTGHGPYGSVEMGGMFSVFKVRDDLASGDYRDPGWYRMPPGTQAHAVDAGLPPITTDPSEPSPTHDTLKVRKPNHDHQH
jgi:hypothetical protein